jgi:hypothetical protein
MEVARVKEPFSFGAPEQRRFAMQFGYDTRPSFWQGLQSNSHLVIAAVGTAALLGVAAVALWLALPAKERQAIASPEQTVPAVPVKTTKVATIPVATTVAAMASPTPPQADRKADKVSPAVAAKAVVVTALASDDPRWTGSGAKPAASTAAPPPAQAANPTEAAGKPAAAAAFAEPAAGTDAATELAKVAAPNGVSTSDSTDGAQTAAIPEVQPGVPPQQPAAAGNNGSQTNAKPHKAAATSSGRILRPVTMRSGPKTSAAAIVTVPAKTSVQLVSCKQWCEIVYNGKHGWVYKSYIKPGA